MRENKGITLVALVITIIVLLILAGVSISLVVGDNGVLTQAQNASTETNKSSADSAVQLTAVSLSTNFMADTWTNDVTAKIYNTVTVGQFETELEKNGYKIKTYNDGNASGKIENPTTGETKFITGLDTASSTTKAPDGVTFEIYEKGAADSTKATKYRYELY